MANPYFNATYYLTNNPDVFAAGINTVEGAWEHYVNHGAAESLAGATSRKPAPWFDASYYLTNNPDLSTAGLTAGQLFEHFTVHGISEGRAPSAGAGLTEESLLKYALANEDLLEAFDIADDATELTDAQALALASQFYSHGYMESRPDAPFEASVDPDDAGATFTLTTLAGGDYADTSGYSINGGAFITNGFKFTHKNETVNATNASFQAADALIDGSTNDNDKVNLALTGAVAGAATLTNIETLNIDANLTTVINPAISLANVTGMKTINVNGSSTVANVIGLGTVTAGNGVTTVDASGLVGGNASINVSFAGNANAATVTGSDGADNITGSDGADVLVGGAGNDTINGGNGNDNIDGGAGNDNLSGGAGNDTIEGGAGNDTIDGGAGNDVLNGGAGNDSINGGDGDDTIDGGEGNDILLGGVGNDVIVGGAGNDTITGGAGNDTLTGGEGRDTFVYTSGADGRDTITDFQAGANADIYDTSFAPTVGAFVVDTGYVTAAGAVTIQTAGAGADSVAVFTGALQATITDFANGAQVLAALSGTSVSVSADGDSVLLGLVTNGNTYLYEVTEGGDGDAILEAADLTLVGVFEDLDGSQLVTANFA